MTNEELERLVNEITYNHDMRKDRCDSLPLLRRPFKRRPTPKTAKGQSLYTFRDDVKKAVEYYNGKSAAQLQVDNVSALHYDLSIL